MTVGFTDEILGAAQTMLKTGMSFVPKIVQKGDLMFWPEGTITQLASKVPAILIKPIETDLEIEGATGISVQSDYRIRVVIVDSFDPVAEDVVKKRIDRAEDVVDRFMGGTKLDMRGATIAGFRWFQARPIKVVYVPQEDDVVSMNKDRQLFAVAVDVSVTGEADRL